MRGLLAVWCAQTDAGVILRVAGVWGERVSRSGGRCYGGAGLAGVSGGGLRR
jgi:hypothetical protein